MNVIIGINNSERIALDKEITVLASLNGILRDGSSLKNPNILIECDVSQIANANYMEIPDFGRSYFITEKESVTNSLFLVTARCDVLTSYASQIRLNTAIVHKQENDWNLYLNDGALKIYQNPQVITKEFPSGFTEQEFVLAVAGS